LLATVASLGLTTSATLIPVAQTKTLLSGLATAVTGLDKAYSEKELLSNTIQALQTQMRADRMTQAGVIYAKMYRAAGNAKVITPIAEYTLPMALSDADGYYQAGTINSAVIGLTKTVSTAAKNAEDAKLSTGPNPGNVAGVKEIAAPRAPAASAVRTVVITPSSRGPAYQRLRALMYPGGTADTDIARYAESLLGDPPVQAGMILNDEKLEPLYGRISNCIQARGVGKQCPVGSLKKFR
jgi:hypothetical protein